MTIKADENGLWASRLAIGPRGDAFIAVPKALTAELQRIGWKNGDRLEIYISKTFNRADERENFRCYFSWVGTNEKKNGEQATPQTENTSKE